MGVLYCRDPAELFLVHTNSGILAAADSAILWKTAEVCDRVLRVDVRVSPEPWTQELYPLKVSTEAALALTRGPRPQPSPQKSMPSPVQTFLTSFLHRQSQLLE